MQYIMKQCVFAGTDFFQTLITFFNQFGLKDNVLMMETSKRERLVKK
jgi:hypothetical protein